MIEWIIEKQRANQPRLGQKLGRTKKQSQPVGLTRLTHLNLRARWGRLGRSHSSSGLEILSCPVKNGGLGGLTQRIGPILPPLSLEANEGSTQHSSTIWQKVRRLKAPLKKRLFLWRMLHDILLGRINLEKREVLINPLCSKGLYGKETNFHVIFICEGIFMLWFMSSLGLRFESRSSRDLGDWRDGLLKKNPLRQWRF